ncbi:uncharacterized protein F4822DRAFT_395118 [Hypoxylon trugodes]|uniref:uncharacterized protein n=1 Tax=Hypoxylon trugodes TaxID=326681 RepID=UPI00219523A0|nr:uncharacterized protein F4822DRAFT_395118 [Hypoxylon trugodes]KAI1391003.1 hypothetical protein F4822DRAFT_395118 [Hypoxylon trugodes]
MEGFLLIPPDRGAIIGIGRAAWKPRYLVVGPQRDAYQPNTGFSQVLSAARLKDSSGRSSKPIPRAQPDAIFLSIYKTKDDWEPIQQHSIASVTECQVQMVTHRKQGPVLPTLAIQISPDPATDKLRKRRSSRTAGLTTTKESGPTTLWLRLGDDRTYTLEDWARYIQSLIQPEVPGRHPISPISPTSPTFINPFSPSVARDTSDFYAGTSSGSSSKTRTRPVAKSSGHAHASSRDANISYISGSPSIRSQRSDISSSHASSMVPVNTSYAAQHYTSVHPFDLPSPATTVGEYHDQFIEGWTSAQGRSSTLSSPIRARGSVCSSPGQILPSVHSSSPPGPRETILDRAFQLRCIPGSDREVPGEEKLSSLARFEALMREAEERQKTYEKEKAPMNQPLKSTWEEDESEEEEEVDEDDEDDSDEDGFEQDLGHDEIGPSAQKALQFIANRHSSGRPQNPRMAPNYHESGPSILRPHTAHSRLRPAAQRTSSQPHIPTSTLDMSAIPARVAEESVTRRNHEKRHSTSDVKRLSFNEFTKRLSGTSSLLLVQTNQSASSSRGSSEIDGAQQTTPPRGTLSPRGAGALSPSEREERCRWRGSVGVFGANEGGFL